jgi:hypothetical protein
MYEDTSLGISSLLLFTMVTWLAKLVSFTVVIRCWNPEQGACK